MSPITRYGFAALIILFGLYQLNNGRPVAALLAVVVGTAIALLGRRG